MPLFSDPSLEEGKNPSRSPCTCTYKYIYICHIYVYIYRIYQGSRLLSNVPVVTI